MAPVNKPLGALSMPIGLTREEVEEIQKKYHYLITYDTPDPTAPIDPVSYTDSNGDTLLHIACHQGDRRTVELLLKAEVDVNQVGDMGYTALHYAKDKSITDLLLTCGAVPVRNEFGKLPGE